MNMKQLYIISSIYHFLGKEKSFCDLLRVDFNDEVDNTIFNDLINTGKRDTILEDIILKSFDYFNIVKQFDNYISNPQCNSHSQNNIPELGKRIEVLNEIYDLLGSSKENSKEYIENSNYFVESDNIGGISRNPFKRIRHNQLLKVLTAINSYLLRGHCCFWIDDSLLGKDINCAKSALNDFLQARYLNWRLFNSVMKKEIINYDIDSLSNPFICVRKDFEIYQDEMLYISNALENEKYDIITWWVSIIIDIFRANVYSKIYNYGAAIDLYSHALQKFDTTSEWFLKLKENSFISSKFYINNFLCKTIAKTRIEIANLSSYQGNIIESLEYYCRSLMDFLLLSVENSDTGDNWKQRVKLYKNIKMIVKYLSYEKKQPIHDKYLIRNIFESINNSKKYHDNCKKELAIWNEIGEKRMQNKLSGIFDVDQYRFLISPEYSHLTDDALSNVRKILDLLSERVITIKYQKREKEYKILRRLLNERNLSYLSDIYATNTKKGKETIQEPNIEKIFTNKMVELFKTELPPIRDKNKKRLAEISSKIGSYSIESIENIIKIPRIIHTILTRRGYRYRAQIIAGGPVNKFVILRRWQSYNPSVPRPARENIPGGGYFLLWEGKGIVIDPGYNFIQNFYDQGFSLEDIDAIVITHAHSDHTDEMNTILTLIHEWNDFWRKMPDYEITNKGEDEEENNEEGVKNRKENSNKLSKDNKIENNKNRLKKPEMKKVDLFLNESSYRKYETWIFSPMDVVSSVIQMPSNSYTNKEDSWQREDNILIDLRDRYNLVLEIVPSLHDDILSKNSAVGLKFHLHKAKKNKSDFVIGITSDTQVFDGIEEIYESCNIVIAHLGDIKLRNLLFNMGIAGPHVDPIVYDYFKANFKNKNKIFEFLKILAELDLVNIQDDLSEEDRDYLNNVFNMKEDDIDPNKVSSILFKLIHELVTELSSDRYQHLGIQGIFRLFDRFSKYQRKNGTGLFVIGEFPEELWSLRQLVARLLNNINTECKERGDDTSYPRWNAKCMTGDIGLHIGLGVNNIPISIRCYRCNQNNELVRKREHYHPPEKIQETIMKRLGGAMTYLCITNEHAILPIWKPKHFLNFSLQDIKYDIL